MAIAPAAIRAVRERVSAGLAEIEAALEATHGDVEAAVRQLTAPARSSRAPTARRSTVPHSAPLAAMPELANEIGSSVPPTCILVRTSDAWTRFPDGRMLRAFTGDFAGPMGGRRPEALAADTVAALKSNGLVVASSDPTASRTVFLKDERCIRVSTVQTLLLEHTLNCVRVDLQRPGTTRDPGSVAGMLQRCLDELAVRDVISIERTVFVTVPPDLVGGGQTRATFAAHTDLPARLSACGYHVDAATGAWRRSAVPSGRIALSVTLENTLARWEAAW